MKYRQKAISREMMGGKMSIWAISQKIKSKNGVLFMSYAIIRNAKYKMGAISGISRHNERHNSNYSNKDIDLSRSDLNYHLRKPQERSYEREFYRIREENDLKGNLMLVGRKQSNVVCEFMITSDNDFFQQVDHRNYFQAAYEFAVERCGGEQNILSAVVHMDETTPHMHLIYIPVVDGVDRKGNSVKKINCSEFWKGFNSYGKLQDDFYEFITKKGFDLQRGVKNESRDEKRNHLTVIDFKISTVSEDIESKKSELRQLQDVVEVSEASKLQISEQLKIIKSELEENASKIEISRQEKKELERGIESVRELRKLKTEIDEVQIPKQPRFGSKVQVPYADILKLREQAMAYIANRSEILALRKKSASIKKREDEISKKEDEMSQEETRLEKERQRISKQIQNLKIKTKKIAQMYDRQYDINQILDNTEKERDAQAKLLEEARKQIKNLKNEIIELNTKISQQSSQHQAELQHSQEHAVKAYNSLKIAVTAIGMVKYDDTPKGYVIEQLTPKHGRLIDGIINFSAEAAKKAGYDDIAKDIKSSIGISEDIKREIKKLEPKPQVKRRGMSL